MDGDRLYVNTVSANLNLFIVLPLTAQSKRCYEIWVALTENQGYPRPWLNNWVVTMSGWLCVQLAPRLGPRLPLN
jgi:hypothetical protein